jgi:PAS domain S-box-containing protein
MMEQITGHKRDELIGKNFAELGLLIPEELPTVASLLADNAAGKSTGPAELTIKQKGGGEAIVEIRTFPTEVGGQSLVLGIGRDITERKRMQEQLIVTDRLASVGELASGIAHELNNPLTGVIGLSQLLVERDIPEDIKEDIKLVYSEAQRAANVVRGLLTFARKHPAARQLINLNDVVSKVLELRAYEQRVSNIEVVTHLAPDLLEIMADYFQLQQVFLNIVINAEHFMTEAHHKGTLTITTERVKDMVRISFADDGPGIPKDYLGHVFDPFFTTKEVGKGTGLGLSISYGIITAHGGQIYAESELDKGATFIIDLPIIQREGKDAKPSYQKEKNTGRRRRTHD